MFAKKTFRFRPTSKTWWRLMLDSYKQTHGKNGFSHPNFGPASPLLRVYETDSFRHNSEKQTSFSKCSSTSRRPPAMNQHPGRPSFCFRSIRGGKARGVWIQLQARTYYSSYYLILFVLFICECWHCGVTWRQSRTSYYCSRHKMCKSLNAVGGLNKKEADV